MASAIFTMGGGAGIGSYVLVFRNGVLAESTDFAKVRGAYDSGDSIFLSIIDEGAQEALIPASGWVDEDNKLHLIARDFDDDKTYTILVEANAHEADVTIADGIDLGDTELASKEDIADALADKADLVDGKVPPSQLPSYVDDVVEYPSMSDFPEEGESDKIYVALDTNLTYRWSGTEYIQIGGQDLSDYYTKEETDALIEPKADKPLNIMENWNEVEDWDGSLQQMLEAQDPGILMEAMCYALYRDPETGDEECSSATFFDPQGNKYTVIPERCDGWSSGYAEFRMETNLMPTWESEAHPYGQIQTGYVLLEINAETGDLRMIFTSGGTDYYAAHAELDKKADKPLDEVIYAEDNSDLQTILEYIDRDKFYQICGVAVDESYTCHDNFGNKYTFKTLELGPDEMNGASAIVLCEHNIKAWDDEEYVAFEHPAVECYKAYIENNAETGDGRVVAEPMDSGSYAYVSDLRIQVDSETGEPFVVYPQHSGLYRLIEDRLIEESDGEFSFVRGWFWCNDAPGGWMAGYFTDWVGEGDKPMFTSGPNLSGEDDRCFLYNGNECATVAQLNQKQDTLVSGTNIKTLNNQSLLGSGNIDIQSTPMVNTTYAELKALRDGGNLVPGMQYRITDYVTTAASGSGASSAGHPFDIIVVADSLSALNASARAALHNGDAYFANSKLHEWQIWYDLDNDTNKYNWATSDGKGVIFRMIDEFRNDCPFDFKNLQYTGFNSSYTFAQSFSTDYSLSGFVRDNVINPCYEINSAKPALMRFPKIAMSVQSSSGFINGNLFSCDCHDMQLQSGAIISRNVFGTGCDNIRTNSPTNNSAGYYDNHFGDGCSTFLLDFRSYGNTFGDGVQAVYGKTSGSYAWLTKATIRAHTTELYIASTDVSYPDLLIGESCHSIKIGANYDHISIGNGVYGIEINDYAQNVILEPLCRYLTLAGGTSSQKIHDVKVCAGTYGTAPNKQTLTADPSATAPTVFIKSGTNEILV